MTRRLRVVQPDAEPVPVVAHWLSRMWDVGGGWCAECVCGWDAVSDTRGHAMAGFRWHQSQTAADERRRRRWTK